MGKEIKETLSKEEIQMTIMYEKVLNISTHEGSTNQNHNELSHHIC